MRKKTLIHRSRFEGLDRVPQRNLSTLRNSLGVMAILLCSSSLLEAAPTTHVQSITYGGETVTMRMDLQNLRGSNFGLWVQNASGGYDVITPVDERSYIGTVDEYPDAVACGILQDDGTFRGAIYFDRGVTWRTLGNAVEGTQAESYAPDTFTNYQVPSSPTVASGQAGSTTYGFDIGIDAENDYYSGPGQNSTAKTFELIEYNICLTRAQYMRDALLRPYLGRVILRADQTQDPYTAFGGGNYLDALRTHWNTNHTDANSDLVAGVCPTKVGGGLAWVGVVGTSSGYSVNDSGSSGSFDVVFRHEMGHNWDCGHFIGGSPEGTGFMGGNATGRMSGCEVYRVLNHRNAKISAGGILDAEGTYTSVELPPYASFDAAEFTQTVDTSVTVDVLANDHDANGQSLSLTSFDAVSAKGGTITRQGDNLIYTAQGSYVGTDYFKYVITDSAGQTATGVVVVDVKTSEDLKLYLALDETTGTSAENNAAYANNGGVSGTDFSTASVAGKFANAIELDGVDDHLTVSGVDLNSNTVTLTAWIKPNGTPAGWAGLIFDRSNGAQGLNFGGSGELRYHWNNDKWGWDSGLVPTPGVWNFVALVIEPNQATMYLNSGSGFQTAVNASAHAAGAFGNTYIGRDPNSAARSFAGAVDEARIFGSALSQADLQTVYDGGSTASPSPFSGAVGVSLPETSWSPSAAATSYQVYLGTSQSAVQSATTASTEYQGASSNAEWTFDLQPNTTYFWRVDTVTASSTMAGDVWTFTTGATVYEPGLIAHWEMNEGSGSSIADSSSNTHSGTINGAGWTTGYTDAGLQFDGVDDSVSFGSGPALGGQTNFTVTAWVKTSASSDQVIVQQRDAGGFNGQYRFMVNSSGQLQFYLYGDSAEQFNFSTSATINDGQWHFVAAVRDGQNGYLYIDGNPVAAASASGTARSLASNIGVAIGRDIRDNNRAFNGSIDEVKIYDIAQSGQDLADMYNDYLASQNTAPVANDGTFAVAENSASGTAVGTVSATDAGDTLSYAITAGNDDGKFAIDSNTGTISTAGSLDHETTSQYVLTVTVTDSGNLTDSATITVDVTNVNEPIVANDTSGTLAEDAAIGAAVATVTTSDPDAGDSVSFAITAGNTGNAFAIDANGNITTATALNYEAASSYSLTVTATDGGGLSDTATVTVTVTDVDESANTGVQAWEEAVYNGSAAQHLRTETLAGNTTTSVDLSGISGDATYEFIVNAEDLGQAEARLLDSNGWGLRFEQWSNSGSLGMTQYGVADHLFSAESGQSVASPYGATTQLVFVVDTTNTQTRVFVDGVHVGTLAQAPNLASSNATLGFATLRDDADPGIVAFAAYNAALDASEIQEHKEAWFGAAANEAPVASDATFSIAENVVVSSAVGTVSATDPNAGDTLTYAITAGNTGNAFAIDNSGNITTAAGLDFETTANYNLTVTVSDDATPALSDTATVSVTVNDVNEAPVANDNSGTLAEDVAIGTAVATVSVNDVDAGDSHTFAITGGNTGNAFAIDNNGNITTAAALDYETLASYTLTVTVTDSGALTDTATVNVTVTDVVETTAPVVATGSATNIAMNSADLGYSITDDGGEAPSVTLYYGETDGGTTPASWANSVAVGAKATGAYTESISGLTAGTNYFFTLAATNSVGTTWGSTGSFATTADTSPKMVRTTVNSVSSTTWTTVNLGQSYNSAVIVATPIYADSTQVPVVTRIRNVAGSSFELKLDRADGLTAETTCNVSVIAVEEGVYTLANDGVQMEAVKYTSTITADNNNWSGEAQTYANSYTAPVVVGQVMSANDANWSVFWSMGASRTAPASASVLNVGKHVGEDPNATRANETVGYIVIESGSGTINGVAYEAALGADTVRGFGNSSNPYTYSLSGNLASASAAALSVSGMDGNNGAWAVLSGATPLTTTTLGLHAAEDQMNDAEQSHTTTQVGYIIFE